jgi:hypothetical protein
MSEPDPAFSCGRTLALMNKDSRFSTFGRSGISVIYNVSDPRFDLDSERSDSELDQFAQLPFLNLPQCPNCGHSNLSQFVSVPYLTTPANSLRRSLNPLQFITHTLLGFPSCPNLPHLNVPQFHDPEHLNLLQCVRLHPSQFLNLVFNLSQPGLSPNRWGFRNAILFPNKSIE